MDEVKLCPFSGRATAGGGTPLTESYVVPMSSTHKTALPVTQTSMQNFADDPIAMMRQLHQTHGDIACVEDEQAKAYFVFHPQYNQILLSQPQKFHSRFFALRGSRRSSQRRLTEGLLSMNDDEHRRHRRLVKEPFSRRSIASYASTIRTITSELIDSWQIGQTVDINAEMTQYMLRMTSALLFGIDHPEKAYEIGHMIDQWVRYNHRLGPMAFASHPDLADEYESMLAFGEQLEQKVRQFATMKRQQPSRGDDVLSLLLQAHDDEGDINDDQLVGHITLLFAAAHLTTAHTFTWTHLLISQHPEIAQKLLEEFQKVLQGRSPQVEDLPDLKYLERVIKESMRIMPASAYSQRINVEPVELGPFQIPTGSAIIFSQFMTHHRPDFYPDPQRFDPDRWLAASVSPYSYLPFGAGPRMCVGAGLALQILSTALPMMYQRFRLSVVPQTTIDAKVISTMLNPMTPVMTTLCQQDGDYQEVSLNGNISDLVTFPSQRKSTSGEDDENRSAA